MDLRQLERALAAFAVFSPTQFPIHHAQVFLYVATKGGCTYKELEDALSLSNSTVSRTVHALGETHRKGYDGLGLLEAKPNLGEGKGLKVRLTNKGKALVRQIEGL